MPPKVDQAAIIILDVGKNVASVDEKGKKSFFDEARECAARVIERKIMSKDKNLLGIILLGSKNTKNTKAAECDGAFRHVEFMAELQPPTWKMIEDLPTAPSKKRGDWIDALVVAADHFINGVGGVKIMSKKVILMTNFLSPTNFEESDIDQVVSGFKDEHFEIDIIGPDIYDDTKKSDDIQIARKFIETTNGATATFEYAMRYLLFHKKKTINPMPWNTDLSIGPNIKIPISSYIRLKDEPAVKSWMKAVKDPVTLASSSTEGISSSRMHINVENQEVVEPESAIKGYHYGQQIIPFSECDKTSLYDSGERSLILYGFTHASKINWQCLKGDGLAYVFGRKGDKKAQFAIRCLIECLHEKSLVGIVRRVYNKGNAPKMFALMPVIDTNDYVCLSMIEMCFKDDIKYMSFPSTNIKRYAGTDEQVNAFKDLIKAMDLSNAYDESFDDTEAFPVAETVSPSVQYVLDCIAYRAMNPGKPLPEPRDDIMMLFKIPPLIEKRSKEPLEKLKNLFTLTKVETKTRDKKKNLPSGDDDNISFNPTTHDQGENDISAADMPSVKLPSKTTPVITRIGTLDPINDFKALVEQGKSPNDLYPEIAEAIENLVSHSFDGVYSKALEAMKFYRQQCVQGDPNIYNNWLTKFKLSLSNNSNLDHKLLSKYKIPNLDEKLKKENLTRIIETEKLNFILKEENDLSTYENADSHNTQLYENDTVPDETELTIDTEVNDMFDEM